MLIFRLIMAGEPSGEYLLRPLGESLHFSVEAISFMLNDFRKEFL